MEKGNGDDQNHDDVEIYGFFGFDNENVKKSFTNKPVFPAENNSFQPYDPEYEEEATRRDKNN